MKPIFTTETDGSTVSLQDIHSTAKREGRKRVDHKYAAAVPKPFRLAALHRVGKTYEMDDGVYREETWSVVNLKTKKAEVVDVLREVSAPGAAEVAAALDAELVSRNARSETMRARESEWMGRRVGRSDSKSGVVVAVDEAKGSVRVEWDDGSEEWLDVADPALSAGRGALTS